MLLLKKTILAKLNMVFQFAIQVLTAEDAGLLEGDEEQEFTGQIKQTQIR